MREFFPQQFELVPTGNPELAYRSVADEVAATQQARLGVTKFAIAKSAEAPASSYLAPTTVGRVAVAGLANEAQFFVQGFFGAELAHDVPPALQQARDAVAEAFPIAA